MTILSLTRPTDGPPDDDRAELELAREAVADHNAIHNGDRGAIERRREIASQRQRADLTRSGDPELALAQQCVLEFNDHQQRIRDAARAAHGEVF